MSLSPQNVSRLHPPQQRYRQNRRQQRDEDAARENHWKNSKPRRYRRMKVSLANPDGDAQAKRKAHC